MNFKKEIKFLSLSVVMACFGLIFSTNVQAQEVGTTDFTDLEYEKFVEINAALIPMQEEVQGQMMNAIKEEGLEVERFQELAQAQRGGTITDATEDTEEIAKFNKAGQKVMNIQRGMQTQAQEVIKEKELPMEKFQQMSMAYNQDQEVKAKVDTLISKKVEQQ